MNLKEKNKTHQDGGFAALIQDESQPSAFRSDPEAAAMDAAAIINGVAFPLEVHGSVPQDGANKREDMEVR